MDLLILICYKEFGQIKEFNSKNLQIIRLIEGFVFCLSNITFGILMDKLRFQILIFFISTIEIIISASISFITLNDIILIILIVLVIICIGGTFSILPPEYNKIFGLCFGAEFYGITGIYIGTVNFIGTILSKFLLVKELYYKIAFFIGGILCVTKMCILIFSKEKKYIYSKSLNLREGETTMNEN